MISVLRLSFANFTLSILEYLVSYIVYQYFLITLNQICYFHQPLVCVFVFEFAFHGVISFDFQRTADVFCSGPKALAFAIKVSVNIPLETLSKIALILEDVLMSVLGHLVKLLFDMRV